MGAHLDLDDVAQGHPVAMQELADLRLIEKRYNWLRDQKWEENTLAAVLHPKDAVKLGHDLPRLERLDEAIDEFMKDSNAYSN